MSLATLLVAAATLLVAGVGTFVAWWVPKQIRVRDVVRSGAPELDISVSRFSGPGGTGFNVRVKNVGNGKAYDVTLVLPGIVPDAIPVARILAPASDGGPIQVPLDERRGFFTELQKDLQPGRLTYRDRFDFLYTREIHVEQRRQGERYDLAVDAQRYKTASPVLTTRDTWRLRNE